jgi:hypothetical protein
MDMKLTLVGNVESQPFGDARRRRSVISLSPKDEGVLENFVSRRSRPHEEIKRQVIPAVLAAVGLPASTRVRWSQKAGCGCGCSPGFVVEGNYGVWYFGSYVQEGADVPVAHPASVAILSQVLEEGGAGIDPADLRTVPASTIKGRA